MTTAKAKKQPQEKTYTRKEMEELLRKQLQAAADGIQGNMSEYCIKKTIKETGLIDI